MVRGVGAGVQEGLVPVTSNTLWILCGSQVGGKLACWDKRDRKDEWKILKATRGKELAMRLADVRHSDTHTRVCRSKSPFQRSSTLS